MKFLVPNYSCLQNPWLGDYHPQIPVLCLWLNLLNPPLPPEKNSWVRHCLYTNEHDVCPYSLQHKPQLCYSLWCGQTLCVWTVASTGHISDCTPNSTNGGKLQPNYRDTSQLQHSCLHHKPQTHTPEPEPVSTTTEADAQPSETFLVDNFL